MPSSKSPSKPKPKQLDFEAIGTQWHINLRGGYIDEKLTQAINKRIEQFDRTYSRFRSDSLVSQIACKAGHYPLPQDAKPLLDFYKQLYDISGGLVTPLIGQSLSDAGYDAMYSLQPKPMQSPPIWDDTLSYTADSLMISRPILLDFGAAGKGYLIDIIADLLLTHGATDFIIDAGGDIFSYSQSGAVDRIGLENPAADDTIIGVADIRNQSICGSAGNRRAWQQFTHILHPKTLESPRHITACWAIADTAMLADGLTTALYFVPAEKLLTVFKFEYIILYNNGRIECSSGFAGELFSADKTGSNTV